NGGRRGLGPAAERRAAIEALGAQPDAPGARMVEAVGRIGRAGHGALADRAASRRLAPPPGPRFWRGPTAHVNDTAAGSKRSDPLRLRPLQVFKGRGKGSDPGMMGLPCPEERPWTARMWCWS